MARYIDVNNAIKAVKDLCDCPNGFSDTYDKACIIGLLQEVPTEDVAPVIHAKWKGDGEVLICSNCKGISDAYFDCYDERFEFNGITGWARRYPKYCKRCGAEMEDISEKEKEKLIEDLFEKENNDNTV